MFHIKNPAIARVIINKDNKISKPTDTIDRGRPPNIRMNYCKYISNFAKMVETQFSKRIKIFRSDNALEYTQYAFQAVL